MSSRIMRSFMLLGLICVLSLGFARMGEAAISLVEIDGGASSTLVSGKDEVSIRVVSDDGADMTLMLDRTDAGTVGAWDVGDYDLGLQTLEIGDNLDVIWHGGDVDGNPVPLGTYNVLLAPTTADPLAWPPSEASNRQLTIEVLICALTLDSDGFDVDNDTIETWTTTTDLKYVTTATLESRNASEDLGVQGSLSSITATSVTGSATTHTITNPGSDSHGYIFTTSEGTLAVARIASINDPDNRLHLEYQTLTSIGGTLSYSGSKTGTFYISAYSDPGFAVAPSHTTSISSAGVYTLLVSPGVWYISGFLDENSNAMFDYSMELTDYYVGSADTTSAAVTGVDFEILDFGAPFTIRGAVGTATNAGDNTTWAAVADAVVKIMDTQGDWNPDNDVMISSTTTTSTFSAGGVNKYNFEMAGLDLNTTSGYQYEIKVIATGYDTNYSDSFINLTDTSYRVYQHSFTLLETAPTVAITNLAATPSTISPDNDGTADMSEISFTYTITGATNDWQKGASFKVIVDTNQDGQFAAFSHDKFFWDENGGPYVYLTTPGDESTIDLDLSTWSWFEGVAVADRGDYKLSWDKFNSLQQNYDWSRDEWINSADLTSDSISKTITWEGRDANWNAVPNGTYKVKVIVDSPNWQPDDGYSWQNYGTDWTSPDTGDNPLTVTVQTAGISGTVTNTASAGVAGVRVNAGSFNSWGQAYTKADGTYEISGLAAGSYHVNTESGASGYPNAEYPNQVTVTAGTITPNINFELQTGGTISGTITIPAFSSYTDQWGTHTNAWLNVNAWSPTSPQHGWAGFNVNASTSPQTMNYQLHMPAGTYDVRAEMEGFSSAVSRSITVESDATTALNITMLKAGTISGTIILPAGAIVPEQGLFVDISAHSTDGQYFGWGGTQIMSGNTSAQYTIRSLLDATYTVKFQIWGAYKAGEYADPVEVASSADVTGIDHTFEVGSTISGTITIADDTTNYSAFQGDASDTIQLWINAWSPTSHFGTGVQAQVPKGVNQSAAYTIGGLDDGQTYHVDLWMFGYEMDPRPLQVTVAAGAGAITGQDITLSPYAGSIAGTVTGFSDYTAVRVIAREPWWGDWQVPKFADVDGNGAFSITGLGTGEYILTTNEYYVKPSTDVPLGVPTGAYGTVTERVQLANGQSYTGLVLELTTGGAITGTITVDSATYSVNDLDGKFVTAVPMRMQWMGWAAPYMGPVSVDAGVATYAIRGLSEDVYIVSPPMTINQPTGEYWGPPPKDLAGTSQTVSVGGGQTKTSINFALIDGYNITGSIQRPAGGEEEQFFIGVFKTDGGWSQLAETQVRFSSDQNNISDRSATFTIQHIAPGNYMLRVFPWKMKYKETTKEFTIGSANVDVGTIKVTKGATITGKLVDSQTGEAVTGDDNIEVMCEARPWVEGSWRSTSNGDPDTIADAWETVNDQKTGRFYLRNLPAGTYMVRIVAGFSKREVTSSKNYVNIYKAGIIVPDSTENVDIGTIKMKEGVTISGNVTDTSGTPLANIIMAASPSSSRGEKFSSQIQTDRNGNYTIKGVDPDKGFWDVTAAMRPWWGEGIRVRYGEQTKINIPPRSTDVDFELESATANLSGQVLAASGVALAIPFPGENMPVALLLLQNKSQAHTEPMSGVEAPTRPDGSFTVQGLVPGTYKILVYSKGASTAVVDNVIIEAGDNTLDDIQLVQGGAVYGTIKDDENQKLNTTQFELPLAMRTDFSSMVFGTFNSNSITKEIESYRIEGLVPGVNYYVVLAADEGSDVFISTTPVSVSSATAEVEHNVTYTDLPPNFLVGVYKDGDGIFTVNIWASETLSEDQASDVISLKNDTAGDGVSDGTLASFAMADNKQDISAVYTPAASDTSFVVTITGHDLIGQVATPKNYSFPVGVDSYNLVIFNPLLGGTLEVGEGDSTKMKVPGGAIEDTANVEGALSKVQTVGTSVTVGGAPIKLPLAAYPANIVQADKAPKPARGDKVSPYYEVSLGTSEIAEGKSVQITLGYTAASVSDTSTIDVYSFDGTKWVAETSNRAVNETNSTISADVNHTSLFAVFETEGTAPTVYTGDFKAYVYPSPFDPETDTTAYFRVKLPSADYGTGNKVKIKIYNITGELIRELNQDIDGGTQDTLDWDGKNAGGNTVASGVYIYRLTVNDTEKQIEKFAVIK
ncbi:MAG: carboxypeptidase regulatory-like domain-containing protein [bacterium]